MTEPDLSPVLDLLPSPAIGRVQTLRGDAGPWLVEYGSICAVVRRNELSSLVALGFTQQRARSSVEWLHTFLRDLARSGFVAPAPINDLAGASIAVREGAIWELLTFVPGEPAGWGDVAQVYAFGRTLAVFHDATKGLPGRRQRPGALPLDACRPKLADAAVSEFRRELEDIAYRTAARSVIHGDATNINNVVDDGRLRLVDFAIAYQEATLADVAFALWRNGRTGADSVSYDPRRVGEFVRGYASVRRLEADDGRAIIVYLEGRGLQLQHRAELRGRNDVTIMQRLASIRRQREELTEAIRPSLGVRIR